MLETNFLSAKKNMFSLTADTFKLLLDEKL